MAQKVRSSPTDNYRYCSSIQSWLKKYAILVETILKCIVTDIDNSLVLELSGVSAECLLLECA